MNFAFQKDEGYSGEPFKNVEGTIELKHRFLTDMSPLMPVQIAPFRKVFYIHRIQTVSHLNPFFGACPNVMNKKRFCDKHYT